MSYLRVVPLCLLLVSSIISCSSDAEEFAKEVIEDSKESIEPNAAGLVAFTYEKNEGPDKNPLKGWNSGWWNDLDHATVGFQYIGWDDFEPANNMFDFDAVENIIDRPGSRDRHLILRIYNDWYGEEQESRAGPAWLYNEQGVGRLRGPNGKYITDCNDPKYIAQAIEAAAALAEHYDNDPRIYAVQIGFLGYWGEWHSFSYGDGFEIQDSSKNQMIEAFQNNFKNVKIMGRQPWEDPLSSAENLGYHNDYFGPYDHSDEFDDAVEAEKHWLKGPIGGEYPPDLSPEQYTEMYTTDRGMNSIKKGHYSTMKAQNPCEDNPTGANCTGFKKMHKKMGYNYQIEKALFQVERTQSEDLSIRVDLSNIGVAPMYYNWDVQFAILNTNNEEVAKYPVDYDIRTVLSNTLFTVSTVKAMKDIAPGDYKVALRIIQPEADVEKPAPWKLNPRNTYIVFSNDLEVLGGSWANDNALKGGWSILGDLTVK